MSLKLRAPRLHYPWLWIHIPTTCVLYLVYVSFAALVVLRLSRRIDNMFEFIPGGDVTFYVVAGVTAFVALLAIVSQFVDNEKSEAVKAKEAKLNGETYDYQVNGKISKKFFWGYPLIALIGAVIVAAIVMFALNEVAVTKYAALVSNQPRAIISGCVAAVIAFMLVDKFVLRKVMDGLFFKEVESEAIEDFLNDVAGGADDAAEAVKSAVAERVKKLREAGFSDDDIDAVLIGSKKD